MTGIVITPSTGLKDFPDIAVLKGIAAKLVGQ